jgi:hypothetical protein
MDRNWKIQPELMLLRREYFSLPNHDGVQKK